MKRYCYSLLAIILLSHCGDDSSPGLSSSEGTSQGGSLARFAISDDHLYIVNDYSLVPIDISDINSAETREKVHLGFDIETIFPYQNNLFVGSQNAVYILSTINPDQPELRSIYQHSTGCDPVVVKGSYAYVTLRDGFSCNNPGNLNVLQVVDISDLSNPTRISSINMTSPGGLGIGCNNKLYVCEGENGLVQFDLSDPTFPFDKKVFPDIHANDVIVRDNLLIVTGEDGIYQFDCSADTLRLLSKVELFL